MNCKQVGKFIYAFADGELGTVESLEVLEHLKMCPVCCRKADGQQKLKASLARVTRRETAPAALHDRIAGALLHDQSGKDAAGTPNLVLRFGTPLAVAAVVTFALLGLWNAQSPVPTITDTSPVAAKLADNVYALHQKCAAMGPQAHDATLPRDPEEAARALTSRLNIPIARCRKLPNVGGTFESATICEFVDVDGTKHRGGHLVFRCSGGDAISLISVPLLPEMVELRKRHLGSRDYVLIKPTHIEGVKVATIAAWDCPMATHIVCAPMTPGSVVRLAEPVTMAELSDEAIGAALARLFGPAASGSP